MSQGNCQRRSQTDAAEFVAALYERRWFVCDGRGQWRIRTSATVADRRYKFPNQASASSLALSWSLVTLAPTI